MINWFKKVLIRFLYKLVQFIEKIEYRKLKLDENDLSKKIINSIELEGDLLVKSDTGLVPVSHIHLTQPYRHYDIILENGYDLSCADIHILFDGNLNEVYAKDLNIGDYLYTDEGIQKVTSIKRSKKKTSMCDLTINHDNHRYYTNGILSHNTISSAIYILHYMLFNNTKNILIAANKFDTAVEIMDKIKDIYMGLPFFLKQGVSVWNQRTVKFQNGCRMKAFTMTKTSSIGNTADFVYVDEFAYIHNNIAEAFYKSIQPTLISVENSKMIVTSTPNGINLFQKLLTDAERPEDDPLKNNFGNMRVYWHQVPGRNVTYLKLKPLEMAKYNLKTDDIFNLAKDEYDPNREFDMNGLPFVTLKKDPNNGRPIINIINSEDLNKEDILKLHFKTHDDEELPISVIADVSTWKDDAIKDIGSPEAFAQEYDLRFINTSKSIFTEETIHRLERNARDFKYKPHEVFGSKLKWDYSSLKWIDDDSIFNEANRKKIKGVISVDVSEGLGLDYSVINIFRIAPKPIKVIEEQQPFYQSYVDFFQLEQIGMFRSNIVSVTQLTEMLYLLGFEFFNDDNFKVVLEINNHGLAVFTGMKSVFDEKNNYGSHIFMKFKHRQDAIKKKIGIKVTGNKKLMVKDYQEKVEDQDIIIYERTNIREITTFIKNVTPAGNVKYEADGSSNDDCVPPTTLITTNDGIKMIKDIEIGDLVLTHEGRYRKVTKLGNRHSEYIYNIKSNNKLDLQLTDNHKLFLFEKKNFTKQNRKLSFHEKGEWISIDDNIDSKKHYTSFIPNQEINDTEYIDLFEYCDIDKFIIKDDKIVSIMYENKEVINPKQNPINRYLPINDDMCYIFGYYLAEGSSNGHQISFASHKKESNVRKKVIDIFEEIGLKPFETYIDDSNSCRVTVSSKILANFFKQFGKSNNKKLPSFCNYLPDYKRRNIINGYLIGDGCFSQMGIRAVSISPSISFYIYESLVKLGYKPSLKLQKQPVNNLFNSREYVYCVNLNNYDKEDILRNIDTSLLSDKKVEYINNTSDKKSYQKFVREYLIGKIRNVEKMEYNDLVYNIEVEEDNSYIANGIVVHNCVMTVVNLSQVFDDNIFRDMVEEIMKEIGNTEVGRYINQASKNVDYNEGIDYQALINVNKRRRITDRRRKRIEEGDDYSNEVRRGL